MLSEFLSSPTVQILVLLMVVLFAIRVVWRVAHGAGYVEGHNDASLQQVTGVSHQVISHREDGSIEQVTNHN